MIPLPLIPLIFGIPLLGFWLWMMIDLANNTYITRESKNYWFAALIFLNVIGAIWYYVVEYRPRHL